MSCSRRPPTLARGLCSLSCSQAPDPPLLSARSPGCSPPSDHRLLRVPGPPRLGPRHPVYPDLQLGTPVSPRPSHSPPCCRLHPHPAPDQHPSHGPVGGPAPAGQVCPVPCVCQAPGHCALRQGRAGPVGVRGPGCRQAGGWRQAPLCWSEPRARTQARTGPCGRAQSLPLSRCLVPELRHRELLV